MVTLTIKTIVLLFIILLGALAPYLNISKVYSDIILHENPSNTNTELSPEFLSMFYNLLFRGILYPSEYNITQLLNLTNYMYIPSDMKYIISRLNELISKLNNEINETKYHVNKTKTYIDYKAYDKALKEIKKAKYWLIHANLTLFDIERAEDTLISYLGRYGSFTERFYKEKDEMNKLLKEIHSLLEYLLKLISDLEKESKIGYEIYFGQNETYTNQTYIERTYLDIYLNTSRTWIGNYVELYGKLYTGNYSLPNRKIYIVLANKEIISTTDNNGNYSLKIKIPYLYTDRLLIIAFYIPEDGDIGKYMPSSNETYLNLLYYHTKADLYVDRYSHPGLPMNISFYITPWKKGIIRNISIFFDRKLIGRYMISSRNYSIQYKIPVNMQTGPHMISLYISPYKEYSGYQTYQLTTVSFIEININVEISPDIIVYPLSSLYINGSITDITGYKLSNESVEVYLGNRIIKTSTNSEGKINITTAPPPAMGLTNIKILVTPNEPWYEPTSIDLRVTVINLYVVLISFTALIGILYVSSKRILKRYRELRKRVEEEVKETRIEKVTEEAKIEEYTKEREEIKEKKEYKFGNDILNYYYSIIDLLKNFTDPPYKNETLREYYRRVKEYLGNVSKEFWKMTLLTEYALYSGKEIGLNEIREANKIYNIIKGALHGKG